jgi:hypothetical protein
VNGCVTKSNFGRVSTDYNCTQIVLESLEWKRPVEQNTTLPYTIIKDINSCQDKRLQDIRS